MTEDEWDDFDEDMPMNMEPNPVHDAAYYSMELIGADISFQDFMYGFIRDAAVSFEDNNKTTIVVTVDTAEGEKNMKLILPTTLVMDDREKDNRYVTSTIRYMLIRQTKSFNRFKYD